MTPIDEHLAALPEPQRTTLEHLRDSLRQLLPTAEEKLSYRMPCFAVQGKAVAGFESFREHCSYFPHSGTVIAQAGPLPAWADADAGTLRFPIGKRLPKTLLRKLIRVRLDEISAVTSGKRFEFFDDGTVRAAGSMRAGELHGDWRWYRRDGSLLRTGSFRAGEQVGTWTTYDRAGNPVG
ncbi:MAG: DUF1801 domain-containing protein [Acidimicrobiales bacterium]|nr:DUF1801 domain-containing protein [Acidimicrobiales bacterium]